MFNMIHIDEYKDKLDKITSLLPKSAKMLKIDQCQMSSRCCWKRTCELVPNEIPLMAKYLKITVEEFIKEYTVGDHGSFSNGQSILRLRNVNQKKGIYLNGSDTFTVGACIMLDKETRKCKIHNVKPESGKNQKCWRELENSINYSFNLANNWKESNLIELYISEMK